MSITWQILTVSRRLFFMQWSDLSQAHDALLGTLISVEDGVDVRILDCDGHVLETMELTIAEPHTHLFVRVRTGVSAQVSVTVVPQENACTHTVEIILEEDAQLTYLCLQDASPSSAMTIRQRTQIGTDASLIVQNITLGGQTVDHDLVSRVVGNDATSGIDWVFYGKGKERQKLTVRNIFDAKNGGGEILMKGVAQDTAHVAANGLIEIGLQGGGTNTYLTQNVLMLDRTSKVDAIPGLEIKTNDVKASHSATVSRVTPEDLFYFAARGIPEPEARRMYVLGFLGDIAARIPSTPVRHHVLERVEEKYARA